MQGPLHIVDVVLERYCGVLTHPLRATNGGLSVRQRLLAYDWSMVSMKKEVHYEYGKSMEELTSGTWYYQLQQIQYIHTDLK